MQGIRFRPAAVTAFLIVPALLLMCFVVWSAGTVAQQKSSGKSKAADKNQKGTDKSGAAANPQKGNAQKASGAREQIRDEILTASDGWPIHITYYESGQGKESPAVILLASAEGPDAKDSRNRRVWTAIATALQKAGYAVAAVDLRKHGDSVPAPADGEPSKVKLSNYDYVEMAGRDLEAVKSFLMEEHKAERLNVRKLGIVSVGSSGMVSAAFAVADWAKKPYPDGPTLETSTPRGQDVRALIMYSPSANVKNISTTSVLKTIKGLQVAVYVVASQGNDADAKSAEKIYKAVELKGEEFADVRKLTLVPGETHGEAFLEGRLTDATGKDIIGFLNRNLQGLDFPWTSRRDRREE